jgi:hypothetical protein
MTECRLCGQPIHFSDSIVSKHTGKKIPLSEGTDDPHTCAEWKAAHRRYYPCGESSAEIYFDDSHISKNGKHIPLSQATGEPHECEAASPKA